MRGLVPRIHDFLATSIDVDGRDKRTAVRHRFCLMECTALILLDSSDLRINWTRERTKAVRHQNIVFHSILKFIPWSAPDHLELAIENALGSASTDREPLSGLETMDLLASWSVCKLR